MKINNNKFKNLFSIFMALYPILCIYKGIGNITIGDILLIGFVFINISKPIKNDNKIIDVLIFLIFTLTTLFINLIFGKLATQYNMSVLIFRYVKLFIYFISIFILNKKCFDKAKFKKTITTISILLMFFLVYQYIMYLAFNKVILGRIPGLNIHLTNYDLIDYEHFYSVTFRPCSFFLEPAMYCQYMVIPLILNLFDKESNRKNKIIAILLTIGMVMSTSGQGILFLIIIYLVYFYRKYKKNAGELIIALIFALIFVIILYNNNKVFYNAFNRLLFDEYAQEARLGTYKYMFNMDLFTTFIGNGYGVTPNNEYLAGIAYITFGTGLIGLIMVLKIFSKFYFSSKNVMSKLICFLFFVMFWGTSLFYNYMLFWFFGLVLFINNYEKRSAS